MTPTRHALRAFAAALTGAACLTALADDAAIRKTWTERNPTAPAIDEISKTPIPGLYELRIANEIVYASENGDYLMFPSQDAPEGHIIETKSHTDITGAHLDKLTGFDVASLPFKDAIVRKQGSGARRVVVFEDPNCHYCKDVEKSLVELKDVTIYTFLIPILGPDSVKKSRDIWCSKDASKTWVSWMLQGQQPPREMGTCDSTAMQRNV
ncbi:MAG TPA: DsbC family protein, partial [Burkholderiaceae bacterium]|nr:DsbC family protein [Burkholderiaceae bacterium]